MGLFGWKRRKVSRQSQPSRRVAYTRNLQAAIWLRENEAGERSIYWAMDRINPEDETRPFRSLRVQDLFQVPEFVSRLASAIADTEVERDLRRRLAELSLAMAQAQELLRTHENGESHGDTSNNGRVRVFE
jgi:hypothetical protein